MKYLLLALTCIALVEGTVDPCPQTDHLYYDTSCCETTDCLDSILKTDKNAIDNLVDLKRADGSACTEDDALKYSIDEATNFSGVVCADSGPAVNCVGTWSDYGACANGAKSRTHNVTTPASGGGTACPTSPESAACNGTIGDDCTQASHCASALCDSGTSKCVAAGGPPAGYTLEANGKTCEGAGVGTSSGYVAADEAACATECNNEQTCQGFSFNGSAGANAVSCFLFDACGGAGMGTNANFDSYSKD